MSPFREILDEFFGMYINRHPNGFANRLTTEVRFLDGDFCNILFTGIRCYFLVALLFYLDPIFGDFLGFRLVGVRLCCLAQIVEGGLLFMQPLRSLITCSFRQCQSLIQCPKRRNKRDPNDDTPHCQDSCIQFPLHSHTSRTP